MSFGSQHHLSYFYDNFGNHTRDLFVMPSEIRRTSNILVKYKEGSNKQKWAKESW